MVRHYPTRDPAAAWMRGGGLLASASCPGCATPLYDRPDDQVERVVAEADCGLKWCVPCLAGNFIHEAPVLPTCTHIHPGAAGPCGRKLKGYMEGRAHGVVSLQSGGWSENLKMR